MKLMKVLFSLAAAALCASASAHAQTVQMVGLGSSALFLEAGQAAAMSASIGASCTWTKGKGAVSAYDNRGGANLTEAGQVWVAWQPNGGTCAAPVAPYNVYAYLQTDSTVGDRCLLASPACTMLFPTNTNPGDNLLVGVKDTALNPQVQAALNNQLFNVAGTDIRPEDAKFATIRALTDCGTPVNGVAGSQYLGLGYATTSGSHIGTAISGSSLKGALGGSFNVIDFNLTGNDPINTSSAVQSFNVYDVGAVPVVVIVNPSNASGFGSLLVQNVTRGVLAGFLDGTYGRTSDMIGQGYVSSTVTSTTYVREPLSGTYNTMEYNIPNNTQLQTSQDVGLNQTPNEPQNCNGVVVKNNPLQQTAKRGSGSSGRYRSIGTGNEIKAVIAQADSLGYAFWSAANFASATAATEKYLPVDGVDPLQQVWTDGLVPTAGNGLLGNVSFANIKNGSYPIWSKLRFAATPSGQTGAAALAAAAQLFVSPSQPDFVPVSQLLVVRSHFAPPYNAASVYNAAFPSGGGSTTSLPANGTPQCAGNPASTPEAGGDVGGLIYTLQSDGDFCVDTSTTQGQIGRRQ